MSIDIGGKRISRNIVAVAAQVLVSGLVFFILYRYLYDYLGVEQIGVWALVIAATSVSRIGELGLSAGVVKFVAEALGRDESLRASNVVQTVALTLALFVAVLVVVGYPVFAAALSYFLPASSIGLALKIMPYALASLWVMVLVSVFSGGLDGCMRMDLRSILVMLSHIFYLVLAIILVPKYGLEGVAIAQLCQAIGLMIMLWFVLRRHLVLLPLIPKHWDIAILKQMFGYGVNFQIITIMNMLFDPMVKAIMSKFGGLESLGYYEMANRLILQGRALIVEASRVIVPTVAILQKGDEKHKQLFITSYRLTFFVSLLFFGILSVCMTVISIVWLGYYQDILIKFALLLCLGWFVNTLINPAYFSNLGSGLLRANMVAHILISLFTSLFGVGLGYNYGGVGVVVGMVIGLIVGSIYLLINYLRRNRMKWNKIVIPKNMWQLMFFTVVAIFIANYGRDSQSTLTSDIGITIFSVSSLLLIGWFNPARKAFMRRGN